MLTFSLNARDREIMRTVSSLDYKLHNDIAREWASELYTKALDGKVTSDTDAVAYGAVCTKNQKLNKSKKEVMLLSVEELKESGGKGVADSVAQYIETKIEDIVESDEMRYVVNQFLDMHEYLYIEEGVDIWVLIQKAKRMISTQTLNKRIMEKLQYIMNEYHMKDIFQVVLSNQNCCEILEYKLAL